MSNELIDAIIELEWDMFKEANTQAGQAPYREDHIAFMILRTSQIEPWPEKLLKSHHFDLELAKKQKRNLLMEKCSRMMETVYPEDYAEFAPLLPPIDEDACALIEEIVAVFVGWRTEIFDKYPNLSFQNATVHTAQDTPAEISFETFFRNELRTYSPATLELFKKMTLESADEGVNLDETHMLSMMKKYGFSTLEEANAKAAEAAE